MLTEQLKYDGELNIAIGLSASSKVWKNTKTKWSKIVNKLSEPVKTAETYKQFINANKEEQAKIKDIGGFVGGFLTNGRRDKTNVLYRQIITLDIDFSHDSFWWDFTNIFDCAAVIHSTHKSTPEKPRHRLIIPINREVSQEEYQAISRKIAGMLNIELFDQTTFDVNRLMFWPSISIDMQYYFEYQDGPFLDADTILGWYTDWHDVSEWPALYDTVKSTVTKQEDPEGKKGIVGVFCRTYSIQDAIQAFLSDEYVEVGENRYTYTKGTTAAGMIVYEDKFAYSHHSTDPAGGRLCNAFDLVRIHKFGHLDTGKEKADADKKSYKAMEEFATKDPLVKRQIATEKFAEAKFEFAEGLEDVKLSADDNKWVEELEANTKGDYENSANNLNIIMQNDKMLKNAFKLNIFDNKRYVTHSLPWRKINELDTFKDVDYAGVRNYIECVYGIVANQKVDDALALEFEKKKFHPIIDYLKATKWDGIERIDTLLIDYFGAEDNAYTRAAIRKMLCAAVARIFEPGIKFDLVLILVGEQGTYKSTFVKKLGMDWFSDTFTTVQGKESFEQIQGAWIIEIAELSGLKKAEVETIKHYIAKREDSFRPAYGRVVETYKRQCVFFGTTNSKDFLKDPTGNRRFMPVDVRTEFITKSVINDLTQDEIAQVWAEAYYLYLKGEPLYLSQAENNLAIAEQVKHAETDERKGIIEQYLNRLYPKDWAKKDIYERRSWLDSPIASKGEIQKDIVCVAEIWSECFGKDAADMTRYNTKDINDTLKSLNDWEFVPSTKNFPIYGKQKYYKRKESLL